MQKILVTGGLGFIGSNFINHMLDKYPNHSIINLDKISYCVSPATIKNFASKERYHFVKGNICDQELVNNLIKKVDYVVNFAAESHVDKSFYTPLDFSQTNILGAHNLIEATRRSKNVKKFLHIGTDEVYGSLNQDDLPKIETDKLFPRNPYSATKAGADLIMKAYQITYDLPIVISRSSNNFGPAQYPEKLVPLCITNALLGKTIPIHGNGEFLRDWLFVKDNCRALDLILHQGETGEIYNVGGEKEISVINVAKKILQELEKDNSLLTFVKNRPSQDLRYSLNFNKIKKLGWQPENGFEENLKNTIDWYKKNKEWWLSIKQDSGKFNSHD